MAGRRNGRADDLHESLDSNTNWNWRKLNTRHLFYESFEWYNAALLDKLQASEFPRMRNTHLNLLRHLDLEGTRMTDLAARSNLTKAAITSLVRACETLGLVTVQQDAEDGRARMVRFSPKGSAMMQTIQGIIGSIEHRIRVHMGGCALWQLPGSAAGPVRPVGRVAAPAGPPGQTGP